jgi:hypothetical protein
MTLAVSFRRDAGHLLWVPWLFAALVTATTAAAQGGANVGGVVTDETHAALPGVTVTLLNTNNGSTQVIVTGPEGNYRAVNLQPGPYVISAELAGFAPTKRAVTLLVGANTTIDFTLSVATLAETVTVTGESPLVDVARAQPQSVIVGEQLAALPVLDRNFLVLAQLLPGAAPLTGVNSRFAVTKSPSSPVWPISETATPRSSTAARWTTPPGAVRSSI